MPIASANGVAKKRDSRSAPRVLHVVPALFDREDGIIGGAERYALELARHMAEEVPTSLVAFGRVERRERVGKLQVRVLGPAHYVRGQRSNPISVRLVRELLRADVVHCHQQHILASSLSALFCRFSRRRVFVTDLGGGGWDLSAYISTDRWFNGHLHISQYSRHSAGHRGKPWAHVISGGVDVDKFSPDESVSRTRTALFVGRLLPHKGVTYLLDAIGPGLELEIVGRPYDEQYFQALKRAAVGKPVCFRTDCDDAALLAAYRRALCVVLPSVYGAWGGPPELLGQTLLEGMACGCPAICSNVASMPEIVEDGVNGFVVPPNDSDALQDRMRWLAEHPEAALRMGRAARTTVLERFTWPQVVGRCLAIYAS